MVISPRNCSAFSVARTRVTIESAEVGPAYCFVLLSIYPRIRKQSTAYVFCSFSKSLPSFLGSVTTTATNGACPKS
jgi:hypothetical protein